MFQRIFQGYICNSVEKKYNCLGRGDLFSLLAAYIVKNSGHRQLPAAHTRSQKHT